MQLLTACLQGLCLCNYYFCMLQHPRCLEGHCLQAHPAQSAVRQLLTQRPIPACAELEQVQALVTGGLPTFFDISRSFTAGALQEDSLLGQLHSLHKRMASSLA